MTYAPLNLKEGKCSQYSNRRGPTGLLDILSPKFTPQERLALGNWKTTGDMAAYYSHTKAIESFVVKWTLMQALSETATSVGRRDSTGAWDFGWGDVPIHVPDVSPLKLKARTLCADISFENQSLLVSSGQKIGLQANWKGVSSVGDPVTGVDLEEPLAPSDTSSEGSSSFSSEDSEEADAKEAEQAKLLNEALKTVLASGGSEFMQIHLLQADAMEPDYAVFFCAKDAFDAQTAS